jgi:signal transduction histidine kinase
LGLPLARKIIRMHDGEIDVESVLNEGSTFTVTLPLAEEPV